MSNYRSYSKSSSVRSRSSRSAKSTWDYFFPFLFVIAIAIILFLSYQLIKTWFDQGEMDMSDKIIVNIESGTAKILPWGNDDWTTLYDNSNLLEGDKVKVGENSRIVLKFYDGGAVRIADNSIFEVKEKNDSGAILTLENGRVWVFPPKLKKEETMLNFVVEGKLANVETQNNSEFAFASLDEDAVRVFAGEVDFAANNAQYGDLNVGVGQQIIYASGDGVISETFLEGIDENYKERDWYKDNVSEDPRGDTGMVIPPTVSPNPDDVADGAGDDLGDAAGSVIDSSDSTDSSSNDNLSNSSNFKVETPVVTSHEAVNNSTNDKEIIHGTVAENVTKVRVDHIHNGETFSHILGRYTPGSKNWNYIAVAGSQSNMKPGKNIYEIYAYDADDNISDKAVVVINYSDGTTVVTDSEGDDSANSTSADANDSSTAANDSSGDGSNSNTAGSSSTPSPSPSPTSVANKLAAPAVLSYNGKAENVTTENKVKVVGSVDPKSIRVFVNGFALTGYRGGESQWVYYAAEKYSTLTMGKNTYRVYSVDSEGNKSPITQFEITRTEEGNES